MGNVQTTESKTTQVDTQDSSDPCKNCDCETEHKYNDKLYGTVKPYYRHIILCSGELDWVRKIEKDESNHASIVSKLLKQYEGALKDGIYPMVTASSEATKSEEGIDIVIYPEAVKYLGIKNEDDIKILIEDHIVAGKISDRLKHEPVPYKRCVLICTHGTRDRRCGRIGPQVMEDLQNLLDQRNVPETEVKVLGSSHLGGHKYAGVVVVYPESEWYGYITGKNIEELVDYYLTKKRMCENYRGAMHSW